MKKIILLRFFRALFLFSVLCTLSSATYANNLQITNFFISSQDSTNDDAVIQFDISQDNSWRDSINYDAVWLFVKYSTDGTTWEHATLERSGTNPAGFSTGTDGDTASDADADNIEIVVPEDEQGYSYGCFIQRSEPESGTLDRDDVQIVWDYGVDGVTDTQIDSLGLKIFGIEMVYIPQGSFWVGDTESDYGEFEAGTSDTPFEVTSENAITLGGGGTGSLGNNNATGMSTADDFDDSTSKELPSTFPKGYNAFYMMKYEMSQAQYADFLNTLTLTQQDTRTEATLDGDEAGDFVMTGEDGTLSTRQTITAVDDPSSGPYTFGCDLDDDDVINESDDGQCIAMNEISWMDLAAYADWAALRPMTELEFEKACRGIGIYPTASEYAWGTASIANDGDYTVSNSGASNEGISGNYDTDSDEGNCLYSSTDANFGGPARVGIFAANASNTGRVTAGAGYYGNMELSGNLYERTVTVGNATGRGFLGTHGNGELSSNGNADISDWPGYSSGEVTGAAGSGGRGGGWGSTSTLAEVSNRAGAAFTNTNRGVDSGARLVRGLSN